jgi:hypothetical protein
MMFTILNFPKDIKRDVIIFSMPLFLISLTRADQNMSLYWTSIFGTFLGFIPLSSKLKMTLSAILFIFQVFNSNLYFFTFGYILTQAYKNCIFNTKQDEITLFISKIEILGWLCSEFLIIPKLIKLILGTLLLFYSLICEPPCVECKDPFEEMKKRIKIANLVNLEYRQFIKDSNGDSNGSNPTDKRDKNTKKADYLSNINFKSIFLFEIIYLIGKYKILILFFSFFSFEISEFFIFLIGLLGFLNLRWEPILLVLKGGTCKNIIFRVISTYLIYQTLLIVQGMY